jgi:hypothetical protein
MEDSSFFVLSEAIDYTCGKIPRQSSYSAALDIKMKASLLGCTITQQTDVELVRMPDISESFIDFKVILHLVEYKFATSFSLLGKPIM